MFIDVEVDDAVAARRRASPTKLAEVCPVDIFAQATTARCEIVEENLDECVLCDLCIDAAPAGTVRVLKLYEAAPSSPPEARRERSAASGGEALPRAISLWAFATP